MSHKILSLKIFLNRILTGSKKNWRNKNEDKESLSLRRELFVNDVFVHMNYLILHSWTLVVRSGSHIQTMQTPQVISRIFPWVFRRRERIKLLVPIQGPSLISWGWTVKRNLLAFLMNNQTLVTLLHYYLLPDLHLLLIFVLVLRYMPSTNVLHTRASRKTRKKNVEEAAGRCLDRARCMNQVVTQAASRRVSDHIGSSRSWWYHDRTRKMHNLLWVLQRWKLPEVNPLATIHYASWKYNRTFNIAIDVTLCYLRPSSNDDVQV